MDPQDQFCHNTNCPARGLVGRGNIHVQSRRERRYPCTTCSRTFDCRHPRDPLLPQADRPRCDHDGADPAHTAARPRLSSPAFQLDERTVAAWRQQAGRHGQEVHAHVVQQGRVDLPHVPADELYVKMVGRRVWMAMAVPSRLWLGGVISPRRDLALITALVGMVRGCARSLAILVCVDGLASSVTAFVRVFRHPVHTGRAGRPRLKEEPGLLIGQVVKHRSDHRLVGLTRRVVRGTAAAITAVLVATGTGTGINTASIERVNATSRSTMTPLVRQGRGIAHREGTLGAGMFLVGCASNFCWEHESLRQEVAAGGESGGVAPRRWRPV